MQDLITKKNKSQNPKYISDLNNPKMFDKP